MGILMWEKPEKVLSTEDWKAISADSTPPGVYSPNMSQEDMKKWKATLKRKTKENPYIEIRKSTSARGQKPNEELKWRSETSFSAQILIIVSLGEGYSYKQYEIQGVNVQISMNGQATFMFEEIAELNQAIERYWKLYEQLGKDCQAHHAFKEASSFFHSLQ